MVSNGIAVSRPCFWPISDRETAVQVHCASDANELKRSGLEPRRIAFSVTGPRLEVFLINRSLESNSNWLTCIFPDAKQVFGGDASETFKAGLQTESGLREPNVSDGARPRRIS